MNIIILGPPAAGKGTQGELLAKKLKIPRLSVGALLRRYISEKGKLGKEIDRYHNRGLNVPAKILFKVLKPWFEEHQNGFVVDNLPRNIDQLKEFQSFLLKTRIKIDKVFYLNISDQEALKRLNKRFLQRQENGNYRSDERPELFQIRLEEGFKKEITPILNFFKQMKILIKIDGEQTIEKVHQDILDNL